MGCGMGGVSEDLRETALESKRVDGNLLDHINALRAFVCIMSKDSVPSSQKNNLQALKGQTANAVWGNN